MSAFILLKLSDGKYIAIKKSNIEQVRQLNDMCSVRTSGKYATTFTVFLSVPDLYERYLK